MANAQAILADHSGGHAICAHPRADRKVAGKTLTSMVFQPESGALHIAFGNGCDTPYETYRFAAT